MSPEETFFQKLQQVGEKKPTAPTESDFEERLIQAHLHGDPTPSKPVTLRNLFTHPETHPVVLDFALLRAFGVEWHQWHMETINDEVQETFSTQISELCRQKMRALQATHVSVMPWQKWQVFEKVAQALNGNIPDTATMQALSLDELYVAVDMLDTLRKDVSYSDEVKLYMAASVLNEDVFFVPPPLDFIQLEVSQPHYHCNDCGNDESALFSDGLCSNCTQRMNPLQSLTLEPMQDLVRQGKGKNLTITVRYDPTEVAKSWDEVKGSSGAGFVPNDEDMVGVQVSKLLLARDVMNVRRKQLAEQLISLKSWLETA